MICILKYGEAEFLTVTTLEQTDMHDARRRAHAAGDADIASSLYRREFEPPPGKYLIAPGVLMLVQS